MTVGICGASSTIAQAFTAMTDEPILPARPFDMDEMLPRYLICTGYLAGETLNDLTDEQAAQTWGLNFLLITQFLDRLFKINSIARVVVIGSESAFKGSHDMAYACSKAALHSYVENKQLPCPDQMLVALAPHIIIDSGMTARRDDFNELAERGRQNRTRRWLSAAEVAKEAHHLIYGASVSLSGQVIRMRP